MSDIEVIEEEEKNKADSAPMDKKLKLIEQDIRKINAEIQILQAKKQSLMTKRDNLKESILLQKSSALAKQNWDKLDYPWTNELIEKRNSIFKIDKFRPHQLPTMNATLSKTDCILIMPTGGGKSLCYQLPALISKGITIVVSPLVSLMEDQLMGLKNYNIEAKMLNATSTKEDVNSIHQAMTDTKSTLKLLYVTPEKLAKSKRFMSKLQKMHQMGLFARLAIDEVHCCSQWGHDFRPDYKFLGIMRNMFPGTPILGLTATATTRVVSDVQKILNIQGCLVLKASFNRPNLHYEVREKPSSHKECVNKLAKMLKYDFKDQSGIIYTMSVKDTIELAKDLKNEGIAVAPYHAQLEADSRSKIHKRWVDNIYQVVVATIAFGMGIDKPDVRFVIHHCISKSMENFYQESGRAGRDDKPSKCIVFWRFGDMFKQSTMVFTEQTGLTNLYGLISYCLDNNRCRRNIIADHFGERWEASDCNKFCDNCEFNKDIKTVDLTKQGNQVLDILTNAASLDQRLTATKLVDAWCGKGPTNLRVKEATAVGKSREALEHIIAFFIIDGFLKEDFHFTPYSTISYIVAGPKAENGLSPSPMTIGKRCIDNVKLDISKKDSDKPKRKKSTVIQDSSSDNESENEICDISSDSSEETVKKKTKLG